MYVFNVYHVHYYMIRYVIVSITLILFYDFIFPPISTWHKNFQILLISYHFMYENGMERQIRNIQINICQDFHCTLISVELQGLGPKE